MHKDFSITGHDLTISQIVDAIAANGARVHLDEGAEAACHASRQQVESWLGDEAPVVYGVNTALGNLKDTALSPSEHIAWNSTIPYPHAVGLGKFINPVITRTALLVRANVLSRSYSGVRPALIQRLLDIFNAGIAPAIRELGSTGLSDLGPMAHCAMVASGMDGARVFYQGRVMAARDALTLAGLSPRFTLECKEVLAIMNGSTMTQAAAALCINGAENILAYLAPIEDQIVSGFADAEELRRFNASIATVFEKIKNTIGFENNITCDNPLLFKNGETYDVAMGCNCSNTQVGYDLDLLTIILSDKAAFLIELIRRHALRNVEQNEALYLDALNVAQQIYDNALPASVDSIPTKGGQEDHVEFSYGAARKAIASVKHYSRLSALFLIATADQKDIDALDGTIKALLAEDNDFERTADRLTTYLNDHLFIIAFALT